MNYQQIIDATTENENAVLTNRLIPGDPNFERPEWEEKAVLDGVPISILYRTNPDDEKAVEENGGDWISVDWIERITDVVVDLCECDRRGITDKEILAVARKYGIAAKL